MNSQPKILAFAGSTRNGSHNKKLLHVAAQAAADAGAQVTEIDLADYVMPLFDGDNFTSDGFPESAQAFKSLVASNDGFLMSSPEYNHGISGVLKNAIDWASRKAEGEAPMAAFKGKAAGIMTAAPGIYGGVRALGQLRLILTGVKLLVLPEQMALSGAAKAFEEDGTLKDPELEATAAGIGAALTNLLMKL
ncbi:MAG: NAD(P)H-dependent oxidoreductase [Alphaproteobacteria bacterium]|jgi:chromate reductase, NAD(P)H dehydrogenase (quinone)|nr:NAD(P)H-dependent oxidoreductase [Alphaproteobacteria bacterium]MBT4711049.1 NAD(P)H-dependent oxidoreductase [Alphaproteobacteria bacterium]MBT5860839.1 NAD(P)H-dependent oxidoreductase [Alphaproteobacteria bacterium]